MNLDKIYESALIHEQALSGTNKEFYNDVLKSIVGFYINKGGDVEHIQKKDPINNYVQNSWGCRDKEFTGPVDIIAAGCSQTYGQGIPLEYRWSSVLGEKLNATTATLAVPGWSTQSIVNAIMNYIVKFGKPRAVVIWLPDFFRFDYVTNVKLLKVNNSKGNIGDTDSEAIRLVYSAIGHIKETPFISKKPHLHENVINSETTAFLAGQSLRFLIEYCKEADIELVYGTWDVAVHQFISYLQHLYKKEIENYYLPEGNLSGYVDLKYFYENNEDLSRLKCHSSIRKKTEETFDWGTDSDKHVGTHMHAHVAEKFANRLKSIF